MKNLSGFFIWLLSHLFCNSDSIIKCDYYIRTTCSKLVTECCSLWYEIISLVKCSHSNIPQPENSHSSKVCFCLEIMWTKHRTKRHTKLTYRIVPENRTGTCVMIDSRERSCSKPTCDTSRPSMLIWPPHFSVRRNSAATNDDLPTTPNTNTHCTRLDKCQRPLGLEALKPNPNFCLFQYFKC